MTKAKAKQPTPDEPIQEDEDMSLAALRARLGGADEAVAEIVTLPSVETLDRRIADAEGRRDALVEERDSAIVALEAGDETKRAVVDGLDKRIAAADQQIDRLNVARKKSAEKEEVEAATEAGKARRLRLDEIRVEVEALHATAAGLDADADAMAAKLRDYAGHVGRLKKMIDHNSEFDDVFAGVSLSVPAAIASTLAASGYGFPRTAFIEPDRTRVAKITPAADYLLSLAEKHRG